jgi:hypothetical protein
MILAHGAGSWDHIVGLVLQIATLVLFPLIALLALLRSGQREGNRRSGHGYRIGIVKDDTAVGRGLAFFIAEEGCQEDRR